MADEQLTLSIAKSDEPWDMPSLEYSRMELGKGIEVTVTDNDGKPYDLTDKKIQFVDKFTDQSKGIIIDNGNGTDGGKILRSDDVNGKFRYVFQQNIYQGSGKALFEFSDGTKVDSTNPFYIDIQMSLPISINLDNATYISDLNAFEEHFKKILNDANTQTDSVIKDFQTKTQDAITSGQKSIDDEVNASKKQIDDLVSKTTTLLDSLTTALSTNSTKLADLQTSWETVSKQIQQKADDEIAKVQASFDNQMQDFQTKQDKAISDWETKQDPVLSTKANQSDVDTLNETLKSKADQSAVDSLTETVNKKVDQSDLDKKADK